MFPSIVFTSLVVAKAWFMSARSDLKYFLSIVSQTTPFQPFESCCSSITKETTFSFLSPDQQTFSCMSLKNDKFLLVTLLHTITWDSIFVWYELKQSDRWEIMWYISRYQNRKTISLPAWNLSFWFGGRKQMRRVTCNPMTEDRVKCPVESCECTQEWPYTDTHSTLPLATLHPL